MNSGKTSFVKRILQTDEHIKASLGNDTIGFEIQVFENMTFLTWDLHNRIPKEKALWKRSIMGADALFYMVDSTDRDKFQKNKELLAELASLYQPIRILILASKADSPISASIGEILEALNLVELDKKKCDCDLYKFSAKTGEGMFAIEEWLNKALFRQKERIINYVKIHACVALCEETTEFTEAILASKPTINLITTIHKLKRQTTIFSRTMRSHGAGEEIIEISNYKVVLVKGKSHVVGLVVDKEDSVQRTIDISRNVLQIVDNYCGAPSVLQKTIEDLYPLDISD